MLQGATTEAAQLFFQHNAAIDAKTKHNLAPLHYAAKFNSTDES